MTKVQLNHIAHVAISEARHDYSWDDWEVHGDYAEANTGYLKRIDALPDAHSLALAVAVSHWLVETLSKSDPERVIAKYIDSCWAVFCDHYEPTYFETDDDEWRGPKRALLAMVLINLNDAIFCRDEDGEMSNRTDWILFLAQKPFANSPTFQSWFERSLQKLEEKVEKAPFQKSDPFSTRMSPSFWLGDFFEMEATSSETTSEKVSNWLSSRANENEFIELR